MDDDLRFTQDRLLNTDDDVVDDDVVDDDVVDPVSGDGLLISEDGALM